jgi:hypothetical protein
MATKTIVLHSALAPEAVGDVLLRSVDKDVVNIRFLLPWFIGLLWKGGSRDVFGLIEGSSFRLKRWNAMQWSPNFYGKWEADSRGTRIEGFFDLAPSARWSLRATLFTVVGLAVLGIVLNTLDLTIGTHFTVEPRVGLGISIFLPLFAAGIFLVAHRIGSRQDERLLGFLEQTLAATRVS